MIDERLEQLGVRISRVSNPPAQGYWKLTTARWYSEDEAHGKHAIYVDMMRGGRREMGATILVRNGGNAKVEINKSVHDANGPQGESYGADFPMHATLGSYSVFAYEPGEAGDGVLGLGLGEPDGNPKAHTAFGLVWTWTAPGEDNGGSVGDGPDVPDEEPTTETELLNQLAQVIDAFRNAAPNDDSPAQFIYAETVNDLQKAFAYFATFGV